MIELDDEWDNEDDEIFDLQHKLTCLEDDFDRAEAQLVNQRGYNAELLKIRKLQANQIKKLEAEILKLKGD